MNTPKQLLALLLFSSAALSGCTSTQESAPGFAEAAESQPEILVALPETLEARPSPRGDVALVAAVDAPAGSPETQLVAAAATGYAQPKMQPAVFSEVQPAAVTKAEPRTDAEASTGATAPAGPDATAEGSGPRTRLDALIAQYSEVYGVPEKLVRRVVKRESNFRPEARNGKYWGLMQILPATARSMGYSGPAHGLLDAETNLKYAVKYLKGAYLVADGDHDRAVRFYSRGYYYDAKRRGLLEEAGLKPSRRRGPEAVEEAAPAVVVQARQARAAIAEASRTDEPVTAGRGPRLPQAAFR